MPPIKRVAAAVPHVDVPDKHFGVALGEVRTLRSATKEHLEYRSERQKWQRAKMTFQQGARAAVGARLFALARRGAIGRTSGSRAPRTTVVGVLPKVAISC